MRNAMVVVTQHGAKFIMHSRWRALTTSQLMLCLGVV